MVRNGFPSKALLALLGEQTVPQKDVQVPLVVGMDSMLDIPVGIHIVAGTVANIEECVEHNLVAVDVPVGAGLGTAVVASIVVDYVGVDTAHSEGLAHWVAVDMHCMEG